MLQVLIMGTYYGAQLGIALSVIDEKNAQSVDMFSGQHCGSTQSEMNADHDDDVLESLPTYQK